jgi:hypothetical protein
MVVIRRKVVFAGVFGAVLTILFFGGWEGWRYFQTREQEAACECGDSTDWERIVLWNPFRDRAPEKAADQVLLAIQSGQCETIAAARQICDRENRFKIVSWKLTGMESSGNSVGYRIWVKRTSHGQDGADGPLWMTVKHQGAAWKVTDVSAVY